MTFNSVVRRGCRMVITALPVLCLIGAAGLSASAAQAAPLHAAAADSSRPSPTAPATSRPARFRPAGHASTHPVHFTPSGRSANGRGGNTINGSTNTWAGYAVTSNSGSSTTFNEVQARWVEPAASCDPNQSTQLAVFWVGLDGFGNSSVEQGGTIAICDNGTPQYKVWWEMYPYNGVQTEFSINAGDSIAASVTYNPATAEFAIVVTDLTSDQTMTEVTPCLPGMGGCVRGTAEVVSEDPTGGTDLDGAFYLADYGTNTFTQASVTDATSHTGTLSDPAWQTYELNQVSSDGITKQTTSALSTDGSSFSTTWQAESGAGTAVPQAAVLYQTGDTAPSTNAIEPNISLENTGTDSIPLSGITIKYWFTEDGTAPLEYACDYASISCANISGTFFGVNAVNGADHYLQISFGSGAGWLRPGQQTGGIQNRFWQESFANMSQPNDYSFNAADTNYTLNPHITVYYNGQLIYGTEPG